MKSKIYNLIILDQSGSMSSICNQAIAGVNETIGTIKADDRKNSEDCEQFISLVAFCGCNTSFIMENVPAQEAKTITQNDYSPCCSTPLYDAMGMSLTKLHNLIKDQKAIASVTIITDGYENASRRYTSDKVKKSIEKHKKHGWEFVFIGANIDAVETAGHFGIGADRAINYCSDNIGTGKVYDAVAKATVAMRCCSEETFEEEMCASFAEVNADFNKRGKR